MWVLFPGLARATTWMVPFDGSLPEVYADAIDGDVIELPAGVVSDEIPAALQKRLTIRGQGVGNTVLELPNRTPSVFVQVDVTFEDLVIDGLDRTQMFEVQSTSVLTLTDAVLQGGSAPFEEGGCVQATNGSTVTASNVTFRGCTAATGGAMSFVGATFVCTGCVFENNAAISAYSGGGAVRLDGNATGTVTDGSFVQNETDGSSGGAISLDGTSSLTVNGATFDGNQAAGPGGAIVARNGNRVLIQRSPLGGTTFTNGSASLGGAIACIGFTACDLDLDGATFEDDSAPTGGHVSVDLGTLTVTDSTFRRGHATVGNGGAIQVTGFASALTVVDSVFEANDAADRGGAIFTNAAAVDLLRISACDNVAADSGGAAYLDAGPTMTVRNGTFLRNVAVDSGGGLRFAGTASVVQSTFVQNSAASEGSAISLRGVSLAVLDSVFSEQATTVAVATSPDADDATITVQRSAAFGNAGGDYGPTTSVTEPVVLTDDPFPALPNDCSPPIPVFEGELVDAGNLVDPDGTPSDPGATGGPDADPDLWLSDGDPVPAMWDCEPLSPLAWPGNVEIPGDGIDNDCLDGDAPGPGDTGTESPPDDTGTPDEPGTGGSATTTDPNDRNPDVPSTVGGPGCGCGSGPARGWLAFGVVAPALRRKHRRGSR